VVVERCAEVGEVGRVMAVRCAYAEVVQKDE
jgi:hypothetical protein